MNSTLSLSSKPVENVADFYSGKCVFISGGTGFLGKVIIEKILYSCPQVKKVFVLIRQKRGITPEERIKSFVDDQAFTRIRNKRPQDMKKIVLVSGDITARDLGLKDHVQRILEEKVSVVIHSAATVKFNEPLSEAWKINVEGTRKMLELGRRMKKLEVFIHISTAYTNTDREVIEEILYPAPAAFSDVLAAVKKGLTEEETKNIINGRPNTYTFTKALTEHVVSENHGIIPVVIIRPSIVTAAKEVPMKGLLENWFGCTGFATNVAQGWNRIVYGGPDIVIDLIPVDYVANTVVVAGARRDKYRNSEVAPVYNCCSSDSNPVTLGKILQGFREETLKHSNSTISIPIMYSTSIWIVWLVTLFLQLLPAYIVDFCRRLTGRLPRHVKKHSMVIQNRDALAYFSSHSWTMKSGRTRSLHAGLSPEDQREFPCDPTSIDWDQYLKDYFWGVKRFLEKKF